MNSEYIKDFYCYAVRPQILKRSFIVAIIVGTVLNMINQGDAITGSATFNIAKCLLTYTVPFCVATYGSVSALMAMKYKPESLGSCAVPPAKTEKNARLSTSSSAGETSANAG